MSNSETVNLGIGNPWANSEWRKKIQCANGLRLLLSMLIYAIPFSQNAFAQNAPKVSCQCLEDEFVAVPGEGGGFLFLAKRQGETSWDSLLLDYTFRPYESIQCFGSDTSVYFIGGIENEPTVAYFARVNTRWMFINSIRLPPKFPLVGSVFEGRDYERYKYAVNDKGEITARLDIMVQNERIRKLEIRESYEVRFHLDFINGTYEMEKTRIE